MKLKKQKHFKKKYKNHLMGSFCISKNNINMLKKKGSC
jgi:DNA-binding Xre family transcriptional regulator